MKRNVYSIYLVIFLLSSVGLEIPSSTEIHNTGFIFDNEGKPIFNATVILYSIQKEPKVIASTFTDENGEYDILHAERLLHVLAYKNDSNTPGFNYYPSTSEITDSENIVLIDDEYYNFNNVTLVPAATIKLIGEFESIELDIHVFYPLFINQDEDLLKLFGGYEEIPFEYQRIINRQLLELDSQTIIAPAGQEFYLELHGYTIDHYDPKSSSARPPSYSVSTKLYDQGPLLINQGEIFEYNIRRVCLHKDLEEIVQFQSSIFQKLLEAKAGGYNADNDEERLQTSESKTSLAAEALIEGDYDYAYGNLTEANNILQTINENIENYESRSSTGIPGFPIISIIIGITLGLILSKINKAAY